MPNIPELLKALVVPPNPLVLGGDGEFSLCCAIGGFFVSAGDGDLWFWVWPPKGSVLVALASGFAWTPSSFT